MKKLMLRWQPTPEGLYEENIFEKTTFLSIKHVSPGTYYFAWGVIGWASKIPIPVNPENIKFLSILLAVWFGSLYYMTIDH